VVSGDEVTRLEAKLRATQALLEEVRAAVHPRPALTFLEALLVEKHRAERYNHYFSVLLLASARLSAPEMLSMAAGCLRVSDLVGIVDGEGRFHMFPRADGALEDLSPAALSDEARQVGVILPETDRAGLECALERITSFLTADDEVRVGLAVYPEDGTAPEELLRMASS
jgi:hypothetical protein